MTIDRHVRRTLALLGVFQLAFHALAADAGAQAEVARAPLPADSVALARRYTEWFIEGSTDSLFAHYSDSMRTVMQSSAGLQQTWMQFILNAGDPGERLEERWIPGRRTQAYYRILRYSKAPEPVVITWYLTPRGEITYLGLGLRSQVRALDPQS